MKESVIGFEFVGDSLLAGTFLPLERGLTVIYGLNGAGKTRLLRGIEGALTGVNTDVKICLVARIEKPTPGSEVRQDPRATDSLLLALGKAYAAPSDADQPNPSNIFGRNVLSEAKAFELISVEIASNTTGSRESLNIPLREEIISDPFFLLHATGTRQAPSWEVWPVADSRKPAAAQGIRILADSNELMIRSEWDVDSPEYEVWEAAQEQTAVLNLATSSLRGREGDWLEPTTFIPYSSSAGSPEWLPAISINGPLDLGLDVFRISEDVHEATLRYLGEVVESSAQPSKPADLLPTSEPNPDAPLASEKIAVSTSDELQELAKKILDDALFDAPAISLEVSAPSERFTRPAASWRFRRADGPASFGLEQLSRAEKAWAKFSISSALYWHNRQRRPPTNPVRPLLYLLDEPEASLHRSAETQVAHSLESMTQDPRQFVIAATHSPDLLDSKTSTVIEIRRNHDRSSRSTVQPMSYSDREDLQALGLRPSDLLRWPRIFLLVEGLHDEILLDAFFGDRLRQARVWVLPLRGATQLASTIDSRVLFDFTEAHVVALVDNQRSAVLEEVWRKAQAVRIMSTIDEAKGVVVEGLGRKPAEARFMAEWLTAALAKGLESRVTPYGLSAEDVIEYLPVGAVLPSATNWTQLRNEYSQDWDMQKRAQGGADFKTWLARVHGVSITPALIREAAARAPQVPHELQRLMKFLEAKASQGAV